MLFFLTSRSLFTRWHIDTSVMIVGNLVLFVATLFSFYLFTRSFTSKNAQAIVRTVYSGVLAKMMICLIAVFMYVFIARSAVNKGAIFLCMILYLLYTTVEVVILMKLSKQNKHG